MKKEFVVQSIMCMGCVGSVEKLSKAFPGVKNVDIELETKKVTLEVEDDFDDSSYLEMLKDAGY
ncbi:MAG: hypothetical protein CSB16_00705 [Clostridiales bacterium]|nr:MAG: hypothetical protein CSB16_00705 [Clostridiales bacterium]